MNKNTNNRVLLNDENHDLLIIQDPYIGNYIISYLHISKRIFLNKQYYQKAKQILKHKVKIITTFYLNHKLRLEMLFEYLDEDNLQAIRNYYIIFYPKEYRKSFFEQVIKFRAHSLHNNQYLCVINLLEKSIIKNNYNIYFKDLINILTLSDLAFIGW